MIKEIVEFMDANEGIEKYFLKEELNVKEIKVFSSEEIPSQICKPNARLIGPKFG